MFYLRLLATSLLLCSSAFSSSNLFAGQLEDIPYCEGVGEPQFLVTAPGTFEAVAFDSEGRLIISNWLGNKVHALDAPSAQLRTVLDFIWAPGGLQLLPDGSMLVGSGIDALATMAPRYGFARLVKFDPATGKQQTYARGLSMGNGLVRAADGTLFASNDLAPALDRITPDGVVQRGWYRESPANGLALSNDGSTLFANVSLGSTRILAIDPHTAQAHTWFQPPEGLGWVFLDDLTIDKADRLYAPTYFGGQIWRIENDGEFCALAKNLLLPAGITLGEEGHGFAASSVYVTTPLGYIIEIPNAVPVDGLP